MFHNNSVTLIGVIVLVSAVVLECHFVFSRYGEGGCDLWYFVVVANSLYKFQRKYLELIPKSEITNIRPQNIVQLFAIAQWRWDYILVQFGWESSEKCMK
jgi:hypothetical protein